MNKIPTIHSLSMSEIIADTGRRKGTNQFHVFKIEELDEEKRPSTPTPNRIDHFMIILVTEGRSHMRLNLSDHFMEKNGLLILSPNIIFELVEGTNHAGIGIGFIPEFFSQAGMDRKHAELFTFFSAQTDPHFSLTEREANTLFQILLLLYEKDHNDAEHPFLQEVIHHGFNLFMFELAAIVRNYRGVGDVILTRREDILMSFLKVLARHFKEERSVQFYAHLLFITPKHLTKTVKELTGKTCGEFIDEMVILEAKVLLNDHRLSVAQVADQLHFSDQFFFSKFFKRHTALTPTEFRTKT